MTFFNQVMKRTLLVGCALLIVACAEKKVEVAPPAVTSDMDMSVCDKYLGPAWDEEYLKKGAIAADGHKALSELQLAMLLSKDGHSDIEVAALKKEIDKRDEQSRCMKYALKKKYNIELK